MYIRVFLAPYYKNVGIKFERYSSMNISLYSDKNGNIKELTVNYSKIVGIPIEAIE